MSSKLQNLVKLQQHRQIGNTTFMIKGIAFNKPAIMIFASIAHAKESMERIIRDEKIPVDFVDRAQMKIGKVQFTTVAALTDEKYGYYWGMPVQIDHFALAQLIEQEYKKWLKMVK